MVRIDQAAVFTAMVGLSCLTGMIPMNEENSFKSAILVGLIAFTLTLLWMKVKSGS